MNKKNLRLEMRNQIRLLSPGLRATQSQTISQRILHSQKWSQAQSVLLFVPLPDEPDISGLLPQALSQGKQLLLPQFSTQLQAYQIAPISDLDTDLKPGKYSIPEPCTPPCKAERVDMILVPGLAFDRSGCRLGRGKGFYDQLLAHLSGFKCGVCWGEVILREGQIPTEPHDIRVDSLWNCLSPNDE